MNLSKKHVHKSMSIIELISPMLVSSKDSKEPGFQNDDYEDDFLLGLVEEQTEAFNQVHEEVEKVNSIKYHEFPIEDGYVRVPVKYPGLSFSKMEPPDLKLWTAESAFKEQVTDSWE